MDRIDGANTVDIGGGRRGFRKQDATAGISGTELTPAWFNGVQEEIMAVLAAAGITPSGASWTQLRDAIVALIVEDLSGYLPKAGGTLTGRLFGVAFRAAKGVPDDDDAAVGFAFGADGDTGLFADGSGIDDTATLTLRINNVAKTTIRADGRMTIASAPTDALDVATKGFVDLHMGRCAVYSGAGSFNWVCPAGITRAKGTSTGGGAGGAGSSGSGNAGACGGGGATAIGWFDVVPGQSYPIVVGNGGAGGAAGITGGQDGGTSSVFGMVATGGKGGQNTGTIAAGGDPGTATGGTLNHRGGWGSDGMSGGSIIPGLGGASHWGGGGRSGSGGGKAGEAPGSGGGGAYGSSPAAGGTGAVGLVMVEY